MKVYLAGPMAGTNDEQAKNWREYAKTRLNDTLDPMVRDYRGKRGYNPAEVVEPDKADIESCDLLLANCWQPSYGTTMEIYHAWLKGKKVVTVVPTGFPSPWLAYHSDVIVRSVPEAIDWIENLK